MDIGFDWVKFYNKIIILEKEGCKNNAIEIKLAATCMEHRTLPEYVERNCVNIWQIRIAD